ncbi:MAG: hypothetical protein WKG07_31905 [Hymenobacter sp.]
MPPRLGGHWRNIESGPTPSGPAVLAIECYPGHRPGASASGAGAGPYPPNPLDSGRYAVPPPAETDAMVAGPLTDDPVFGRLNGLTVADLL